MSLNIISGVALALLASACGGARPRGPLSDGERLYLSRCTSCHRTYEPGELSPQQWGAVVAKMERLKKVRLRPEERSLLLGWLGGMGATPSAPGALGLR
jgi:hypothetical protein